MGRLLRRVASRWLPRRRGQDGRTFPVIDGTRYSVPVTAPVSRTRASSSCTAVTRSPSTRAARRSSPKRSSRPRRPPRRVRRRVRRPRVRAVGTRGHRHRGAARRRHRHRGRPPRRSGDHVAGTSSRRRSASVSASSDHPRARPTTDGPGASHPRHVIRSTSTRLSATMRRRTDRRCQRRTTERRPDARRPWRQPCIFRATVAAPAPPDSGRASQSIERSACSARLTSPLKEVNDVRKLLKRPRPDVRPRRMPIHRPSWKRSGDAPGSTRAGPAGRPLRPHDPSPVDGSWHIRRDPAPHARR